MAEDIMKSIENTNSNSFHATNFSNLYSNTPRYKFKRNDNMRATGIVRKADQLGRIVIPKETRKSLFINVGDSLEIFIEDNTIFLKKYSPGCTFCGNVDNIIKFKGVYICTKCSENLKSY